jgi:hypothetical protein
MAVRDVPETERGSYDRASTGLVRWLKNSRARRQGRSPRRRRRLAMTGVKLPLPPTRPPSPGCPSQHHKLCERTFSSPERRRENRSRGGTARVVTRVGAIARWLDRLFRHLSCYSQREKSRRSNRGEEVCVAGAIALRRASRRARASLPRRGGEGGPTRAMATCVEAHAAGARTGAQRSPQRRAYALPGWATPRLEKALYSPYDTRTQIVVGRIGRPAGEPAALAAASGQHRSIAPLPRTLFQVDAERSTGAG